MMVNNTKANIVKILNKEFQVSCPPGSEEQLMEASYYLDKKIREIRNHGRVIGLERMAIMAALNIAAELLAFHQEKEAYVKTMSLQLERLQNKVDEALATETTHQTGTVA